MGWHWWGWTSGGRWRTEDGGEDIPGNVATGGQDPVKMFKDQLRREKEGDKDLW